MGHDTDRPTEADRRDRRGRVPGPPSSPGAEAGEQDIVFDFSEVGSIDLPGLSLLLTARGLLPPKEGRVWVAGLPTAFWSFLRSMGLEGYFEKFPGRTPADA